MVFWFAVLDQKGIYFWLQLVEALYISRVLVTRNDGFFAGFLSKTRTRL